MVLTFASYIALALAFLTGFELLFRPHQRDAVQNFFEDVTRRLGQPDFKQIGQRMTTNEAQFYFIVLAYAELTIIAFAAPFILAREWQPGGAFDLQYGPSGQYVLVGFEALSFLILGQCWKWPVPGLMKFVVGNNNRWHIVLLRFLLFALVGGVFGLLWFFVLDGIQGMYGQGLDALITPYQALLFCFVLLMGLPLFLIFWVVFQAVGLMLQARTCYVRWFFALTKGALLRVVEYDKKDKKAFSAIVLVAAILLAFAKEFAS